MTITIPNLRQITGTPITVPANETWIVKIIKAGTLAGGHTITTNISGNAYNLFSFFSAEVANVYAEPGRDIITGTLILKTGDTITAVGGLEVGYWILEIDFSFSNTIPNLRQSSLAGLGTITVPGGETWIVKLATFKATSSSSAAKTVLVTGNLQGNAYKLLQIVAGGTGNWLIGLAGTIFQDTIILKAADTIVVTLPVGIIAGLSLTTQIGYWILETDF